MKSSTDFENWAPGEIENACKSYLHPEAIRGIELFNLEKYFKSHEAFETAWRAESGPVRELYRGILLASATLFHFYHGNFIGAQKVNARCLKTLSIFNEVCCGINIGSLKTDIAELSNQLHLASTTGKHQFCYRCMIQFIPN